MLNENPAGAALSAVSALVIGLFHSGAINADQAALIVFGFREAADALAETPGRAGEAAPLRILAANIETALRQD